ncbi:MAG: Na(+)/H(+)-K(+) antiporter GerN [Candidatus Ordinivivax streblomastigis]|uniref:Na(+)/H(+)-K(+) antiporter GerN n=1 Tax=Candidatus Ordinivivax streblomastigis TaxID=2540710 RepID=A0A5M8NXG5_9BACT|nr:MAG: Na(+)/H(+)-K(+) antiporter GerN [Candidatus Ordinivivax streblomastigis]
MPKGFKNLLFYVVMLLVCGVLMYVLIQLGNRFEILLPAAASSGNTSHLLSDGFSLFTQTLHSQVQTPVAMLLLQVIAILFTARIFGYLFVKIGQPSVVGEILSGIILGPSVLAHFFPGVSEFLFSPESLDNITILSQIGLIFFMFVIGMELDIAAVKKKFNETLIISHTGIVFPFLCGILAAYWTYPYYTAHTTTFLSYALFIGVSMSITAFPVLARIIQEKGMTKSPLGTLSLASAANGDVTAWCVLAIVIAIAKTGTLASAIYTILFAAAFLLFMFIILRPFLNIIGNLYHNKEVLNKTVVAFMFFILIVSAYTTEMLGIHALFGAFMAGVVMPSHVQFRKILTEKVEDVSLTIFLPLFFVSTGLKTQIGLISTPAEWLVCGMFIVMAVFGKVIGTAIPTRLTGESWKNSWLMGALMNTRGLMELIILTIGYEMAILPPAIFAMLVLMTLVTTFMTAPLLLLIEWAYRGKTNKETVRQNPGDTFRILLSFGRAGNGKILLNVAQQIFSKGKRKPEITALHLTVGTEVNPIHTENFSAISFAPLLEDAENMHFPVTTRYDVTNNAGQQIVHIANQEAFDFLLVGAGISMSALPQDMEAAKYAKWFYPDDLVKNKTRQFIDEVRANVGIFVNRDFEKATDVIVLLKHPKDIFLLRYAENLIAFNQARITIAELGDKVGKNKVSERYLREFLNDYSSTTFVRSTLLPVHLLSKQNFMLVGYDTWLDISEHEKETLQSMPSTLIIRK